MRKIKHNFYRLLKIGNTKCDDVTAEEVIYPIKEGNTVLNLYRNESVITCKLDRTHIYAKCRNKIYDFYCQYFHSSCTSLGRVVNSFVVIDKQEVNKDDF